MRKSGFYWAYDDDEQPQPVEVIGNGKVFVFGVAEPFPETHFVCIGDQIPEPSPTRDSEEPSP